jgi:hypothetical protein
LEANGVNFYGAKVNFYGAKINFYVIKATNYRGDQVFLSIKKVYIIAENGRPTRHSGRVQNARANSPHAKPTKLSYSDH